MRRLRLELLRVLLFGSTAVGGARACCGWNNNIFGGVRILLLVRFATKNMAFIVVLALFSFINYFIFFASSFDTAVLSTVRWEVWLLRSFLYLLFKLLTANWIRFGGGASDWPTQVREWQVVLIIWFVVGTFHVLLAASINELLQPLRCLKCRVVRAALVFLLHLALEPLDKPFLLRLRVISAMKVWHSSSCPRCRHPI